MESYQSIGIVMGILGIVISLVVAVLWYPTYLGYTTVRR